MAQNAVHTFRVIRKGVFDSSETTFGYGLACRLCACGCKQEA